MDDASEPAFRFPREALESGALLDVYAGAVIERAVAVVATLGIADELAKSGPMSPSELAARVGANPDSLGRVLTLLIAQGVFDEDHAARVLLNSVSRGLRSDVPWSLRWLFMASGLAVAGPHVVATVIDGGSAYERAAGCSFWSALERDGDLQQAFSAQMRAEAQTISLPLLGGVEWSLSDHVVDIGGGDGHILTAILQANPHLRGTLIEREPAASAARSTCDRAGLTGRVEVVVADCFDSIPRSGDTYLLSRVLHDWDDDRVIELLKNVRSVTNRRGRLLIVDMLTNTSHRRSMISDLVMLFVFGVGRERTRAELVELLHRSSFEVESVRQGLTGAALLTCRPT